MKLELEKPTQISSAACSLRASFKARPAMATSPYTAPIRIHGVSIRPSSEGSRCRRGTKVSTAAGRQT